MKSENKSFHKNILFQFGLLVFLLLFLKNETLQAEIKVCTNGCEVQSIKEGIEKANVGEVVKVTNGTYFIDSEIIISKPIKLVGEFGATLDGGGKHQIISIFNTNNVVIDNLTIQNTGQSYTSELAGVRVIESENCIIKNNNFNNTTYGVYLEKSKNCVVKNNIFKSHSMDETSSGNGVHMWTGSGHQVVDNKIEGHRDGIYLEFMNGGFISKNKVFKNLRYGLHFMSSNETLYSYNIFSENGAGVAVMYSRKIKMFKNAFVKNSGASSYGLLLKEIVESSIENNLFTENTVGIYMEGSNRSNFKNNEFSKNGFGLKIMGDCENNNFNNNNFIQNTFEVMTNANHSWNTFFENYWSQYSGFDLNKDGVGDKPHRPVSLSSFILEKVDSAYILLNSFFFQVLDEVERAFPEMIPEQLKDESPKMNPLKLETYS